MNRNHVVVVVGIIAAIGGWVYLERSAASEMMRQHQDAGATRQPPSASTRAKSAVVNQACRNLCEPHCADRWGNDSLAFVPREVCFRNCIDVACRVAP